MLSPLQATILGIVEGLTEFLPVSSTGHLILVSRLLDLRGEAVNTFDVVIQSGALVAVLGLYRHQIRSMWRGLMGRDRAGQALLSALAVSFLPAAIVGALLHRVITTRLFQVGPVVGALAIGGLLMIGVDRWAKARDPERLRTLESIGFRMALFIGCAQCLALWPGTSRAMVTILAGLLAGLSATAAAEYSFLLALPTLGAATVFDLVSGGEILLRDAGVVSIGCGFLTAAIVAALAIRGFIQVVTRRGLAPFGWYRVGVAALVWWAVPQALIGTG